MSLTEFWWLYDIKRTDRAMHDWTTDREMLDALGIKQLTPISGEEANKKAMKWIALLGGKK